MRAALVTEPIDPSYLLAEVAAISNGAAVLFVGTVRETNEGRVVTGLDYRAYVAMAVEELERIVREASDRFGTPHVVAMHRLGELALGDVSVAVAAAHPNRAAAFDASRFVIEEIKRRVPVWKLEHYIDGTREWIDPTAAASTR